MTTLNTKTPRSHFATVATAVLLLGSSGALSGCNASAKEVPQVAEEPAVSVTVAEAKLVESPRYLRLTGTLRGNMEANLAANVGGRVTSIEVDRGDRVEKGQILARVDVRAASLALAEASVSVENSKTQLEIDQQECDRYEKLRESGVVSEQQYDSVTARCKTAPLQLEAAKARKNMAAKNVGDGVIRAPFAGVVTQRLTEVGEYLQPSSPVVALAEVDDLKLEFSIPERNIPEVKLGAPVLLRVQAYDEPFEGHVSRLSGAVRATRDMVAEGLVKNPDGKLVPGMFADVEVQVGVEKLPAVPKEALFEQSGKQNVLVKDGDRLFQRIIQIGPAVGDLVPVKSGLSEGAAVVSPADKKLKNGQRVQ